MQIRMIGLTVCLLGMAYTASAAYTWNKFQGSDTASVKPTLATHAYTWNKFQGSDAASVKPVFATHGYTWDK